MTSGGRHPASMTRVAAMIRRDGTAKCVDCSTVLTLSAKLNVCNVSRHRWRSSSTYICGLDARSIVKVSVLAFFVVASLREQNVGRGTLFLLKSFASKRRRHTPSTRHPSRRINTPFLSDAPTNLRRRHRPRQFAMRRLALLRRLDNVRRKVIFVDALEGLLVAADDLLPLFSPVVL